MDSSLRETYNNELDKLDFLGGITGTAIVNRNGLTLISRLPRDVEERKFGALAATMFGAMENVAIALRTEIIHLTVEFNDNQIIIMALNNDHLIVTLIESNFDLGLFLIEIEEIIMNLKKGVVA